MADSQANSKSSKMEMDEDDEEMKREESDVTTNLTSIQQRNKKLKKISEESLMWVEKYRPSQLSQIVSHQNIIDTMGKLVSRKKLPHLLFYGPPGTGKTTTILACAKQLNGDRWQSMTLELNASDERGIDTVRETIKTFASTKKLFNTGFKLVILDEADAMTSSAQFALRRVIEKYTKNTRFCLICNYVNKIIPALQSRCTKFRFSPLEKNDIESKLREIAEIENVKIDDKGVNAIVNLSQGDMRKCINILQSVHSAHNNNYNANNNDNNNNNNKDQILSEEAIHIATGAPLPKDIETILHSLLNEDFQPAFQTISEMQLTKGLALTDIITKLHTLLIHCKLHPTVMCETLAKLADLEHRLTTSINEKIQLASLVGIFQLARHQSFEFQKNSEEAMNE